MRSLCPPATQRAAQRCLLGCSGPLGLRVAEYVRPGAMEEPYVLVDEIKEGSAAAAIQDLVRVTGLGYG